MLLGIISNLRRIDVNLEPMFFIFIFYLSLIYVPLLILSVTDVLFVERVEHSSNLCDFLVLRFGLS